MNLMKEYVDLQSDKSNYNLNFLTGIYCLLRSKYEQSREFFLSALYETTHLDAHYSIYLSYVGLSAVLIDHKNGNLNHCYHSSNSTLAIEPESHLNLACAELLSGNRERAIQAINKFEGFIPTQNSKEIKFFFDLVGKRKMNNKGVPKRNNITHKSMGKLLRKKEELNTEDIEAFIINTAKRRYQHDMKNYIN